MEIVLVKIWALPSLRVEMCEVNRVGKNNGKVGVVLHVEKKRTPANWNWGWERENAKNTDNIPFELFCASENSFPSSLFYILMFANITTPFPYFQTQTVSKYNGIFIQSFRRSFCYISFSAVPKVHICQSIPSPLLQKSSHAPFFSFTESIREII